MRRSCPVHIRTIVGFAVLGFLIEALLSVGCYALGQQLIADTIVFDYIVDGPWLPHHNSVYDVGGRSAQAVNSIGFTHVVCQIYNTETTPEMLGSYLQGQVTQYLANGVADPLHDAQVADTVQLHSALSSTMVEGRHERIGWPLHCVSRTLYRPVATGNVSVSLRPIWSGLIVDSTLFAGMAFLVQRLLTAGRSKYRLRQGRCTYCGFILGLSDAGCPECGWNRLASEGGDGRDVTSDEPAGLESDGSSSSVE